MKRGNKRIIAVLTLMFVVLIGTTVFGADEEAKYVPQLFGTFWALVPPLVAIALALITKEVYSSLFIGIVIGGIFYSGGSFEGTIEHVLEDGIIGSLSDEYNVGIGPVKRRIMDMGITKGVDIYVRKVAPLGDPVEVTVRGYELSLRKADAEMIEVE